MRKELRNTIQIDPLEIPQANIIDGPWYGTRLSTVVLVRRDGNVLFVERDVWNMNLQGQVIKGVPGDDRSFRFQLDVPLQC